MRGSEKHLPNVLSAARIPLALALLLMPARSYGFLSLYLLGCLTDALDGFLARRLNARTEFGARLDSAADFVLITVLLLKLWPVIAPGTAILLWVAAIALVRFAAALTARFRFGVFGFLHTWTNKLTGAMLVVYPLILLLTSRRWPLYVLLITASVSAVEELLAELCAEPWDADRKSFFPVRKGRSGIEGVDIRTHLRYDADAGFSGRGEPYQ